MKRLLSLCSKGLHDLLYPRPFSLYNIAFYRASVSEFSPYELSLFQYKDPRVAKLIKYYKSNHDSELSLLLAQMLFRKIRLHPRLLSLSLSSTSSAASESLISVAGMDGSNQSQDLLNLPSLSSVLVTTIPPSLHARRKRNQNEILARNLVSLINNHYKAVRFAVYHDLLVNRCEVKQSSLPYHERKTNVNNGIHLISPSPMKKTACKNKCEALSSLMTLQQQEQVSYVPVYYLNEVTLTHIYILLHFVVHDILFACIHYFKILPKKIKPTLFLNL